jgi:hypothetical protein
VHLAAHVAVIHPDALTFLYVGDRVRRAGNELAALRGRRGRDIDRFLAGPCVDVLVVASITNVQSLPGPSLIARLSAVTAFTVPTAVIVFALLTLPPCGADAGGTSTGSWLVGAGLAGTSIAIARIIAVFITILPAEAAYSRRGSEAWRDTLTPGRSPV